MSLEDPENGDGGYGGPASPPVPGPGASAGGDIIGASGFNYTQRWGARRGQVGGFQLGSRPVPEYDWNQMTDEEKMAVMGTTDGSFRDEAQRVYQQRSQPGGDIYQERAQAWEAISDSGAQNWSDIERALIAAGFNPSINEQGSLFKELAQIFRGVPLVNTAAYQAANRGHQFAPGMAGLRQYLPGGKEEELMRFWHGQGLHELRPTAGGGFVEPETGALYDKYGYELDSYGRRTGRHYMSFSGLGQSGIGRSYPAGFGLQAGGAQQAQQQQTQYPDVLSSTSKPTEEAPPPTGRQTPSPNDRPGWSTAPPPTSAQMQQFVNTISNPQGTPGTVQSAPASRPVQQQTQAPQAKPGFGTTKRTYTVEEPYQPQNVPSQSGGIAQQGWYKRPGFGGQ